MRKDANNNMTTLETNNKSISVQAIPYLLTKEERSVYERIKGIIDFMAQELANEAERENVDIYMEFIPPNTIIYQMGNTTPCIIEIEG